MRAYVPGFHRQSTKTLHSTLKQTIIALREAHTLGNDVLDAKELLEHKILSEDQYFSVTDDDWESTDCAGGDLAEWLGQPQHQHHLASGSPDNKAGTHVSSEAHKSKLEPRWQSLGVKFVPFDIQRQCGRPSRYSQEAAIYQLAHNRNLYNIKLEDRSTVYSYLKDSLRDIKSPAIPDLLQTYNDTWTSIHNILVTNRIAFIQAADIEVIGCTATGLLKYRELIASLRPKILLMEEAAEIRESDTIAALLPSIEHLIFLGDHQQLQPHVDLPELAQDPYRVNISMFERLIKLGIPHQILLQQRRMIPCLREIVQLFYPRLVDHTPTISKLPLNIPGVSTPLWWFQHDWPESPGIGNSVQNFTEGLMIVRFVQYLVTRANISPNRITLLTYYRGQVDILNKLLASNQWLVACETEWAVRTVDGFQGEENDIILLSLVRGPNGKAGFLTQENRAIVGLSRARVGMYIFGHRDVLTKHPVRGETWSKVVRQMKGKQGRALPLCPSMDTEVVHVDHPDQLKRIIRDPQYRKDSSTHSSGGPDSEKQPFAVQAAEVKVSLGSTREDEGQSPQIKLPFRIEADRPSSPPGQQLDDMEELASDLKLLSFEDFETIPLSAPDCPWDRPPLMPTITPMKEDLLLEFSDDEISEAGTEDS
ncbi:sterol esterase carbohydrate esterase family CE10 [Pochonia chlamydosporia 170]|uniref:Sterol esterase carbohydrate esterase family CE10 n=1 Tax=Pochonia chlamydosporia 170 TaxID=1380566 RepID=A0A179F066_METCM|nr:sterol esterase carbohydrate esterase family CE10 [Pochonia chlamydosporia 170]OAQ58847.1 sterol esterase carbohydrate esterase family CE10 [Pochonia chlamydosporia 170]